MADNDKKPTEKQEAPNMETIKSHTYRTRQSYQKFVRKNNGKTQ